jgi:citrate synthase
LKSIDTSMKTLGVKNELLSLVQFSKTKIEYDSQINELKVQGIMLKDASEMIYKSYYNYLNIFKKKDDPHADDWIILQHKQFNYKLMEILRRFKRDVDSTQNLITGVAALETSMQDSTTMLDAKIKQLADVKISKDVMS